MLGQVFPEGETLSLSRHMNEPLHLISEVQVHVSFQLMHMLVTKYRAFKWKLVADLFGISLCWDQMLLSAERYCIAIPLPAKPSTDLVKHELNIMPYILIEFRS